MSGKDKKYEVNIDISVNSMPDNIKKEIQDNINTVSREEADQILRDIFSQADIAKDAADMINPETIYVAKIPKNLQKDWQEGALHWMTKKETGESVAEIMGQEPGVRAHAIIEEVDKAKTARSMLPTHLASYAQHQEIKQMAEVVNDVRDRVIALQGMYYDSMYGDLIGARDTLAQVEVSSDATRHGIINNLIPSLNGTRGRIIEALTRLLNNFPEVKDSAFGISGQIVKDKSFLTETFENYNRIQELFKCYLLATQLLGYAYAMIEEKASYKKVFIPNEQLVHHPALKNLANFEIALNGNFDQMWYKNPENFLDGIRVKVDMIASKNAVEIEYTGQQLINAIHITKEKEPVIAVKRNGQEEDHGEE